MTTNPVTFLQDHETGELLFTHAGDLRQAVLHALAIGKSLARVGFQNADLSGLDLSGGDFRGASFEEADLSDVDLLHANIHDADFTCAILLGTMIDWPALLQAKLDPIRADVRDVLSHARAECPMLLAAIREGRINGKIYRGECACLIGTIANARGVDFFYEPMRGIKADQTRLAERWFMEIKPGDTPENNRASQLAAQWVEEFIAETTKC